MGIDQVPLERPTRPGIDPTPARRSPGRWIAMGVAGVVASGLLTFWWMSRAQPGTAAPAPTSATEVAVASKRPKRQALSLPSLDESDTMLRDLVTTLSHHPSLSRFLATPGLVRATTLAVVQIGDGRTPAEPLKTLRPASHVQILGSATGRVAAGSYGRWDGAVGALTSVVPADAAQLYVNVKPLFDQAYIELGHPAGDFDTAVVAAIQMLASTPEQPSDPILVRRTNFFDHEDPALRTLRPVQKQFLLLGPEHRRRILNWLRQFASALELSLA